MKIRKLHLENFRLFRELDIEFTDEYLTVLIGGNGSGKSAVLDAIAVGLSLFVGALTSSTKSFNSQYGIHENDINVKSEYVKIKSFYELNAYRNENQDLIDITVHHKRGDRGFDYHFSDDRALGVLNSLVTSKDRKELPVIAYYRIGRTGLQTVNRRGQSMKFSNDLFYAYENSLTNIKSSFEDFTAWFIHEENIENQRKVQKEDLDYRLPSLETVRQAVEKFVGEFKSARFGQLKVERANTSSPPRFIVTNPTDSFVTIEKGGVAIALASLSSGEKSVLLLVADIARRLHIANPEANGLLGDGIILIDEVELHLHPAWQRTILGSLREIFPNIQFIVTTHSPQVLSTVHEENILVIDDGQVFSASDPFGRDTNAILDEIMGTPERPSAAEKLLKETFALLANGQTDFAQAENNIEQLKQLVSDEDPVFTRLANIIKRKKLIAAS